jgi:WD40 repeat protein
LRPMLTKLLATAVVLVASASLSGAVTRAQPASTGAGTVVYTSNRDGDLEIYGVNRDGTGLTQLTKNTAQEDSAPVPSPDGRLIAFHNSNLGAALMNADGSGGRKLSGCSSFDAWSPDSTKVVCGTTGLSIVDVASGGVTQLTQSGSNATWSPDGRTIAYWDGSPYRLWVVPSAGGTPRRVGNREPSLTPAWSPDSQRLAYGSWVRRGRASRLVLFTIASDGTDERRLAQGLAEDWSPQWSPDGSVIAFGMHPPGTPGYFEDIYTVHADGTSLQRITSSRGGESSSQPQWSPDGTELSYTRERYRGGNAKDIFGTSVGGSPGRALTQPFPMGGSSWEARWRIGAPLTGTQPPPPSTITPVFPRKQTLTDPVEFIAADGRRALAYSRDSCRVQVWNSRTGRAVRSPKLCPGEGADRIALAGRRLAWIVYWPANTEVSADLETARLGSNRVTHVSTTIAYSEGGGDTVANLVGNGRAIAFTSYHNPGPRERRRAWLLLGRSGAPCPWTDSDETYPPKHLCRPLRRAKGGETVSVDGGRILTRVPGGAARLMSTGGRVLRTWRLGRVLHAELGGRMLAVQRGASLTAYDSATGRKLRTRPMAADEGRRPYLLDVRNDIVVYATGGAVHLLRLSDGHDVALDLPGAAPPFNARLEGGGLFVTWNQMYVRRPGRLAFVPGIRRRLG